MSAFFSILREIAGLFVDDGSLALAILAVVLLAAAIAMALPSVPLATGAVLLIGCLAILLVNVTMAARRGSGSKRRP